MSEAQVHSDVNAPRYREAMNRLLTNFCPCGCGLATPFEGEVLVVPRNDQEEDWPSLIGETIAAAQRMLLFLPLDEEWSEADRWAFDDLVTLIGETVVFQGRVAGSRTHL